MAQRVIGELIVAIKGNSSELDRTLTQTQSKFSAFSANLNNIGNKMSLFVTAPLLALGGVILKSSASMEMLQTSFETMLGSADKAAKLMADLKKMAASTPFTTPDLANASKMLLQYGVAVEDLIPSMQMLGDIASGDTQKFQSLALVFSQIKGLGRMTGQDLRQMINAGFNPLYVISQKTGESMASLNDKMSKGQISFKMVSDAMKTATSQGGQFFGGMERGSKTLQGLLSTLQDDAMELGRILLADLVPIIKDFVKWLSGVAQEFSKVDKGTKTAILAIAGVAVVAGPAIKAISGIMNAFKAFTTFMISNPVFIIIAAGIAALIIAVKTITDAIREAVNPYQKFVDLQKKSVEETDNLLEKYKELSSATDNTATNQENLKLVTEELVRKYPELSKMVDQNTGILRLEEDQVRNIQIAEKEKLRDTLKNQKEQQIALVNSLDKQLELYDSMPDWWKTLNGITAGGRVIDIARGELNKAKQNITNITDELMKLNTEIDKMRNPDRYQSTREQPTIIGPSEKEVADAKKRTDNYLQSVRDGNVEYANILRNAKEEEKRVWDELRQQDLEAEKAALQEKQSMFKQWADLATGQVGEIFSAFGKALVTGEEGWAAFARTAVEAIAVVLEALGKSALAEGAVKIATGLYPPNPPQLASGAALIAAGAAAMLAGGIVRGLASQIKMASGGVIYPTAGGTQVTMAEAGVAEYAVPDRSHIWNQIADRITSKMGNTNNYNTVNNNLPGNLTLRIGDKEFGTALSDMSRNGKFIVDRNRGISRR